MATTSPSNLAASVVPESVATASKQYYVSVTGLQLKSIWQMPRFLYFMSGIDSTSAQGNVVTKFTGRKGVKHTLTVWNTRDNMIQFMRSGPHLAAIKATKELSLSVENGGTGTKMYGYYSNTIPTWEDALLQWDEHGTIHGMKPPKRQDDVLSTDLNIALS